MAQYNFRLFLKPTVIGKAIIDRLSAEGADRQADSRRWMELGYALEQAGFRLDGTTVFQGGRVVSSETPVAVSLPAAMPPRAADVIEGSAPAQPPTSASTNSTAGSVAVATSTPVNPAGVSAAPAAQPVEPSTPAAIVRPASPVDELADNLRSLSA